MDPSCSQNNQHRIRPRTAAAAQPNRPPNVFFHTADPYTRELNHPGIIVANTPLYRLWPPPYFGRCLTSPPGWTPDDSFGFVRVTSGCVRRRASSESHHPVRVSSSKLLWQRLVILVARSLLPRQLIRFACLLQYLPNKFVQVGFFVTLS